MNNTTTTFAAYRTAMTLNGAALASFLIASGPAVVAYVCDRIERGQRSPRLFRTLMSWASSNEQVINEACLHYDW